LAIGDALAMTLMEVKGMSAEDFAANHPAGRLGKRLTLRVKDLMHPNPSISPTASWIEVVRTISDHTLGAATVIDDGGKLLGIITDGDLRRVIQRTSPEKLQHLTAETMMTSSPVTSAHDSLAYEALQLMENRSSQISVLPVTNGDGRCVGLIRLHDIVRSGL
jgi:arabinose-5-phosphate isomerase